MHVATIALLAFQATCLAYVSPYSKQQFYYNQHKLKQELSAAAKIDDNQYCLLFDCDGVIVETEELHRIAYNAAFNKFGLILDDATGKKVVWESHYYDILQNTVGGGKPKMNHYFNNDAKCWPISTRPYKRAPQTDQQKKDLVDLLQDSKTEFYCEILENMATAREGVLELMDEAIANKNLKVGICSAATRAGFDKLVNAIVGPARLNKLDIVVAGDDVPAKKPDPMIYNVASQKLGVKPENCVVIEDSIVGLKAAKAAGMKCIITYTDNTVKEDFYGQGADAKIASLKGITLKDIFEQLKAGGNELLANHRDEKSSSSTTAVSSKPSSSDIENSVSNTVSSVEVTSTVEVTEVVAAVVEEKVPKFKGWTPHYMIVKSSN